MLKQHGGHVVNMSASIAAHADSVEPTALAALTKGGLAAVTKSLAVEYASRGIRVNAVAPGITQTPLYPAESYTPEALAGKLPPLGRVGQVSDIAARTSSMAAGKGCSGPGGIQGTAPASRWPGPAGAARSPSPRSDPSS
jgi:NAD(P)-dependent dehydrogenase (short-subunit alcohol dehydrogenase family)